MSRKIVADALKEAAQYYLLDKGYSCHEELGLCKGGVLRGDIVAINMKSSIWIVEVKSCVSDYRADRKWRRYLEYSNRFHFIFTQDVYEKLKTRLKEDLKGTGVGVLILSSRSGSVVSKMNAATRKVSGTIRKRLITRMAWRGGTISKRTCKRPRRVYITQQDDHHAQET